MGQKKPHISTKQIIYALIILFLSAAVIIGAWRISADNPVAIENPAEVYSSAVSMLNKEDSVYYKITGTKSFSIYNEEITENFVRYVSIQGSETENPQICVEETLSIGNYDIVLFDIFNDKTEYLTVQGSSFRAPISYDDFMARQIPLIPIDISLYERVSGERTAKQSVITFHNAREIEFWVSKIPSTTINAEGTVLLDNSGRIVKSEYLSEYTCENTRFNLQVTVEVLGSEISEMPAPDASMYKEVTSIETPLQLEKACGYLLSAGNIRADYIDTIACQAFGDERTQTVRLETSTSNHFKALMDTQVSATNSSKAGVVTTTTKSELFQDNVYSIATNGEEPVINSEVDLETMKGYCENLLIGTIVLPQYISTITHTDTDEVCYIAFDATEEFAQVLIAEACNTLYQSPAVLDNMTDTYQTNTVTAYLTLDRVTGFPISSGFYFLGTYTMSGLPYNLSFKADQIYSVIKVAKSQ